MRFAFAGHLADDGTWALDVQVPAGGTVTYGDLIDLLIVASAQNTARRHERIPTTPEVAAMTPPSPES